MTKYILKRLILSIFTIIIAFTITFFILRLFNGKTPDAIDAEIQKTVAESKGKIPINRATKIIYAKFDYHPDWNPFRAFGHYLHKIFVKGDFGKYYALPAKTIPKQFAEPLKYTFIVSGLGFLFGTFLGASFGIIAGYKRGKLSDVTLNIFSIFFVAVPSFVLAAILVMVANQTNWPTQFLNVNQSGGLWQTFKTLVIPIAIITVTSFASITYYVRNEVVEVLRSDYVATARSKGLSEIEIFFSHVLKNISIPAISIILPRFIFIIMGSLIIELFFNVPGSAKMIGLAVKTTEINVILFSIIFFTSLSLLINIVVDVLYTVLDPRIRFANKSQKSLLKRLKASQKRKQLTPKLVEGGKNA